MDGYLIDMKKVECASPSCGARRVHHEQPDVERGKQSFWVPVNTEEPCFCSIECSVYYKKEMEEITMAEAELRAARKRGVQWE